MLYHLIKVSILFIGAVKETADFSLLLKKIKEK